MVISPYSEQYQPFQNRNHTLPDFGSKMQPQDLRLRVSNSPIQNANPNYNELVVQNVYSIPDLSVQKIGRPFYNPPVIRSNPYSHDNNHLKMTVIPTRFRKSSISDRNRKKLSPDSSCSSSSSDPQHLRLAANDRERQRTQQLNSYFADLRRKVPSLPSDKLSKIQTLKLAMRYIQFLKDAVNNGLVLTSGDIPDTWPTSSYSTHDLLSREFLFRRMQNDWAAQRQMSS